MYYKTKQRLKVISATVGIIAGAGLLILGYNYFFLPKKDVHIPYIKVGEEIIYREDYQTELSAYPLKNQPELKKILDEKLIKDSVILQAAKAEKYATLSAKIYNDPNKDYQARVQAIKSIEQKVIIDQGYLNVGIISLWFYNSEPPEIGIEKGKLLAQTTMQKIYQEITEKKLDFKKASDIIKNDSQFAKIDKAYVSNAYTDLKVRETESLTFDPVFDLQIKALPIGGVTKPYLAKSKVIGFVEPQESVYSIAKLYDRKSGDAKSFENWVQQHRSTYEVTYY